MGIVDIADNIIYADLQELLNKRIKDSTRHHDKTNINSKKMPLVWIISVPPQYQKKIRCLE